MTGPTNGFSAPIAVEDISGEFGIAKVAPLEQHAQVKCGSCKMVTIQEGLDIDITGDKAPECTVRIMVCTRCGNATKTSQRWPSAEHNTRPVKPTEGELEQPTIEAPKKPVI